MNRGESLGSVSLIRVEQQSSKGAEVEVLHYISGASIIYCSFTSSLWLSGYCNSRISIPLEISLLV